MTTSNWRIHRGLDQLRAAADWSKHPEPEKWTQFMAYLEERAAKSRKRVELLPLSNEMDLTPKFVESIKPSAAIDARLNLAIALRSIRTHYYTRRTYFAQLQFFGTAIYHKGHLLSEVRLFEKPRTRLSR